MLLTISEQGEIHLPQDNGGRTGYALFGKFSAFYINITLNFICGFTSEFHLGSLSCLQSSVNGKEAKIPFPWLVFNEKVKVNSVFLRDSTAVSDSILLLFGGSIKQGGLVCFIALLA